MDDEDFSLSEDQQARWEQMLDSLQQESEASRAETPPPEEGSLNPESPAPPEDVQDAEVEEATAEAPEGPESDPPPPDEPEVVSEPDAVESESGGFDDVPPPDEPEVDLPAAGEEPEPAAAELPTEQPSPSEPEPVEDDTPDLRKAIEGLFAEGESWAEGVTSGQFQDYTATDFTDEDRLDRAMQENTRPSF